MLLADVSARPWFVGPGLSLAVLVAVVAAVVLALWDGSRRGTRDADTAKVKGRVVAAFRKVCELLVPPSACPDADVATTEPVEVSSGRHSAPGFGRDCDYYGRHFADDSPTVVIHNGAYRA